jgi:hypothetical protein
MNAPNLETHCVVSRRGRTLEQHDGGTQLFAVLLFASFPVGHPIFISPDTTSNRDAKSRTAKS